MSFRTTYRSVEVRTSLKRWRQVGQEQFLKWETPGQELEGTGRGIHDGRFGPLGTLEAADGRLTFPLPVALRDRLAQVRAGALVLVRYTGLQTSNAGRTFKGFEVVVAEQDGWGEPMTPLPLPFGKEA
jgi:hypothetical protein